VPRGIGVNSLWQMMRMKLLRRLKKFL